ncbi:hypothetical protein ACRRHK_002925 [Vibrio fluvialis]
MVTDKEMKDDVTSYMYALRSITSHNELLDLMHLEYSIFVNDVYGLMTRESLLGEHHALISDFISFRKAMLKKISGELPNSESYLDRDYVDDLKEVRAMSKEERYALYLSNRGIGKDSTYP